MPHISILDSQVADVALHQVVEGLIGWVEAARIEHGSLTPPSRIVVTPNPEMVMLARRDPEFARILNAADLAVPDGVGLLWAARLLGTPLRERVPGSVLVPALAERSAQLGHRWFLLGAEPGVAQEAGRVLMARFPGLQVVGAFAGDASPAGDGETRAAIQAAGRVDVLLVAYGAPRQERWMARNRDLGIPVMMGVGGVYNYLTGRSRMAPAWLRRLGFEWLYRLVTEPWRWRRQLALPQFAALVLQVAMQRRLGRPSQASKTKGPPV